MRMLNKIIVHCSASKVTDYVDAAVINKWHKARGFDRIGYHFVILRDGTIEAGRMPEEIGAHAKGHNADSLGVCLVGGLDANGKPENNFTPVQLAALAIIIAHWREMLPGLKVIGHRDIYGDTNNDGVIDSRDWLKDCPCFDVKRWMNDIGI